jgi:hypothetical protein
MSNLAFGCSHTAGVGVELYEAWPSLLNLKNYGVSGCSADYIIRTAPDIIRQEVPKKIYILWPDWTRFEYLDNGIHKQSLPTDSNRILFMDEWSDKKLQENFNACINKMRDVCIDSGIKLIDITLYDLIPYIDHADKWPLSKLGHHYSPLWHQWIADIFLKIEIEKT